MLAARLGEPEAAARLIGAVEVLHEDMQTVAQPVEMALAEKTVAELRRELGDERYEALVTEGRRLTLDEAVELALATVPESQD